MRMTLTQLRAHIEEVVVPSASDYMAAQARGLLSRAEEQARTYAAAYVAQRADEVDHVRIDALHELTEIRDAFDDLTAEGKAGRMPASEYGDRLDTLSARQTQ